MISFGKNIRQANDPLVKIDVKTTYNKIKSPHQKLVDYITQIRTVATIDAKKYRQLKVKLPYLVAGIFNPNFRKKDTFVYTEYFILDIDHINEKELNLDNIFQKITNDKRVVLAFRSPSNDGIKVFFKLNEKCYDSGKFSLFYKYFANKFSVEYHLDQVIDKTTSDVSRACFVSYDPKAYFNADAELIQINKLINFEDEENILEINFELKQIEKEAKSRELLKNNLDIDKQDLPFDLLKKIREKLNPKIEKKKEKNIFTPEELNVIMDDISNTMTEYDIKIESVKNINYGKQFKFTLKHIWTELNVFYGKKGFTIVKSAKNGTNNEFTETCYNILTTILY